VLRRTAGQRLMFGNSQAAATSGPGIATSRRLNFVRYYLFSLRRQGRTTSLGRFSYFFKQWLIDELHGWMKGDEDFALLLARLNRI
jgi:hypothetical protein